MTLTSEGAITDGGAASVHNVAGSATMYGGDPTVGGSLYWSSAPTYTLGGSGTEGAYTSRITDIVDAATTLRVRTHLAAIEQQNELELWLYRAGKWNYYAEAQPLTYSSVTPEINWRYQQPATLKFSLSSNAGTLFPDNRNSSINYYLGIWDPLIDISRKALLRQGTYCSTNIAAGLSPAANRSAVSGALTSLTNGLWTDYSVSTGGNVTWTYTGNLLLTFDLLTSQSIRHAAIRFGSKTSAGIVLPDGASIEISLDGTTYTQIAYRRVGGNGSYTRPPGDYSDSALGIGIEVYFCDLLSVARYIRFNIASDTTQTISIDEVAIYGGQNETLIGASIFVGYMGDQIDAQGAGMLTLTVTDVSKKLKDNNTCQKITPPFYQMDSTDIARSILTGSAFWKGGNEYETAFTNAEVGWDANTNITGLKYPLWQGQANNALGYYQELIYAVGWMTYPDGNGVWRIREPQYKQRSPNWSMQVGDHSNQNLRACVKVRSDLDMRNAVNVSSGRGKDGSPGYNYAFEPNSVNKYGTRLSTINDPILATQALRTKVAQYFIRDYAWKTNTLRANINAQYGMVLRDIYAFRTSGRVQLYPRSTDLVGDVRRVELYALQGITYKLQVHSFNADCEFIPYFPFGASPPTLVTLYSSSGNQVLTPSWTTPSDPLIAYTKLYISSTSETNGFEAVKTYTTSNTTDAFTTSYITLKGVTRPITLGQRYWVYMTSIDTEGYESVPSVILSVLAGGSVSAGTDCDSNGSGSGYVISDYAVGFVARTGPDNDGYYSYEFFATWTSPICGHTQHRTRINPFALPTSDPNDENNWAWSSSSWDWWAPDRIPSGRTWDYTTTAQLNFTYTLKTKTVLNSGDKLYFRIWNSKRTRAWLPVPSNYTSVTIP